MVRRVLGALGGGLLVLIAGTWPAHALPGPVPAAASALPVIEKGHADVLVPYLDAGVLKVRATGATTIEPGEAGFRLTKDAEEVVPATHGLLTAGTWYIAAAIGEPNVPQLAISTKELTPAAFDGTVTVELTSFSGPGVFELFRDPVAPAPQAAGDRVLSSAQALRKNEAVALGKDPENLNWAFSAPGRYRLGFTVTATPKGGQPTKSEPVTHTFLVGPDLPATGEATTTGLVAAPATTEGQTTLTATVKTAEAVQAHGYVEFFDGTESLGYEATKGGVAALSAALPAGDHSLSAKFTSKYQNDYGTSEIGITYSVPGDEEPTPTPSESPTEDPGETEDPDTACTIVREGDVDYAVRITGGKAESAVRDAAGEWFDPGEVVVGVPGEARLALPSGQEFLGEAGTDVWELPQAAQADVPSVGWLAEGTAATWKLDEVKGPGKAVLFEASGDGTPKVIFDAAGDSKELASAAHGHATWGFTAEGVYRLTFTHQTTSGGSDTGTLTFAVGDYDADDLPVCAESGSDENLADTGAPVLLYACVGVILLTAGGGLLMGVNRRFGLL